MPTPGRVLTEVEALLPTLLSHAGGTTAGRHGAQGRHSTCLGSTAPTSTLIREAALLSRSCVLNAWDGPPLPQHLANVRLSHSDHLRCCHSPTWEDTEAAWVQDLAKDTASWWQQQDLTGS